MYKINATSICAPQYLLVVMSALLTEILTLASLLVSTMAFMAAMKCWLDSHEIS